MATSSKSRTPLSRERILEAALELVDEGGIEALSMRKLGQSLGYEAMSLYNHVDNKDDVLNGILDLVLAETEPPASGGDWRESVRTSSLSVHRALRRHPWAAELLMSPSRIRPARIRHMDLLLGRLREAGFSPEMTYHAYHVLDAHVTGFSLWATSHSYSDEQMGDFIDQIEQFIPASEYPHLNEHAHQHMEPGPIHDVSAFELGLDLVLAGLQQRLDSGD